MGFKCTVGGSSHEHIHGVGVSTLGLNECLVDDARAMNLGKLREMVRNREAWLAAAHGVAKRQCDWVTEQLAIVHPEN